MNDKDLFVIIGGTLGIGLLATLALLGLTTKKYVPESDNEVIRQDDESNNLDESDDPYNFQDIPWGGGVTKRRKHKKNKHKKNKRTRK